MSVDIRVCSNGRDFESLRGQWQRLLERSERRSLFLTWEWLEACRATIFAGAELCVVCGFAGGDLVAAVPLVRRRTRYYGVPLTELSFLGDPVSDRQFILDASGGVASRDLCAYLGSEGLGASLVRLEQIPSDSPMLPIAQGTLPRVAVEYASELPFVPLHGTWIEFERRLTKKFRSEMRTRTKVFDTFGTWRLDHLHGAEAAWLLDEMATVETESAKANRGYAFLGVPENRALIARFFTLSIGECAVPVVSTLRIEQRLVAYLLGFLYDNRYHAYNTAYLAEYRRGSPGKFLVHEAVRHAHECGAAEFDLLRGGHFIKHEWQPVVRTNCRCVSFLSPLPGALLRWLVFTARPFVKTHVSGTRGRAKDPETGVATPA